MAPSHPDEWSTTAEASFSGLPDPPPPSTASERSKSELELKEAELKTAYRKMDIRLVAWYVTVIFFLSLDGRAVASAAIMNVEDGTDIQHQLGDLTSEQWALILSVLHYPHIVFQPLSTLLLKRFSPRTWLSATMVVWGVIAICQSAVHNFHQMLVCRLLLGIVEAAFIPAGLLYHLSFWYPASHLTFRIACIAAAGTCAGGFSGLLAFAISYMNGTAGLSGWQWLFILEGIPLVLCGLTTRIFLPNYPEDVKFLTPGEKAEILGALPPTQPRAVDDTINWQQIKDLFKDVTTYSFFLIWMLNSIGAKGVTLALPTVIESLGITNATTTQLLTMPPYIVGSGLLLLMAWLVGKNKINCWVTSIVLATSCGVCYVVLLLVSAPLIKYIFIALATTIAFAIVPMLWGERIRAAHGTTSAALAIGTTTVAPVFFGIVGPQIWQQSFGPKYVISYGVSLAMIVSAIICMLVTWLIIKRRDAKAVSGGGSTESEDIVEEEKHQPRIDSLNDKSNAVETVTRNES